MRMSPEDRRYADDHCESVLLAFPAGITEPYLKLFDPIGWPSSREMEIPHLETLNPLRTSESQLKRL